MSHMPLDPCKEPADPSEEPTAEVGDELDCNIRDLLWSTGVLDDGSSARASWLQFAQVDQPNHRELGKAFLRVSRAPDPLSPDVCHGAVRHALARKLRAHELLRDVPAQRADLGQLDWEEMTREDQRKVRALAADLAAYHRSLAPQHRPHKDVIDTLLVGLAEIFVRSNGQDRDIIDLEAAPRTRFIRFCHRTLLPYAGSGKPLDPSEISPSALSSRWHRYLGHAARTQTRTKSHRRPRTLQSRQKA